MRNSKSLNKTTPFSLATEGGLHLVKLCVGISAVRELRAWQKETLARQRKMKQTLTLSHITRMRPRAAERLLAGGSLYWVIGGFIQARQEIKAMPLVKGADGIERTRLVLGFELVLTQPVPRRAFQGWRYLADTDAPADLPADRQGEYDTMPDEMRRELMELGLV